MCLEKVTETLDGSVTMIESGWKQFSGGARGMVPQFECQTLGGVSAVPLDQWIKAEAQVEIPASDRNLYKPGFHIFTDEKAAKIKNANHRVYFRRPLHLGVDRKVQTVIAQEMYVPTDQDDWPPKELKKKG